MPIMLENLERIETSWGTQTSIWTEQDVDEGIKQLSVEAVAKSDVIELCQKLVIIGGYPLEAFLCYYSPEAPELEKVYVIIK